MKGSGCYKNGLAITLILSTEYIRKAQNHKYHLYTTVV